MGPLSRRGCGWHGAGVVRLDGEEKIGFGLLSVCRELGEGIGESALQIRAFWVHHRPVLRSRRGRRRFPAAVGRAGRIRFAKRAGRRATSGSADACSRRDHSDCGAGVTPQGDLRKHRQRRDGASGRAAARLSDTPRKKNPLRSYTVVVLIVLLGLSLGSSSPTRRTHPSRCGPPGSPRRPHRATKRFPCRCRRENCARTKIPPSKPNCGIWPRARRRIRGSMGATEATGSTAFPGTILRC